MLIDAIDERRVVALVIGRDLTGRSVARGCGCGGVWGCGRGRLGHATDGTRPSGANAGRAPKLATHPRLRGTDGDGTIAEPS